MKKERPLKRKPPGVMQKTFCLNCEKVNACSCGTNEYTFRFYHKLRPPKTKNKVVFRKFLRDCPEFANLVPDYLKPMFRDLLRKVKFFDEAVNGHGWTVVSSKEGKDNTRKGILNFKIAYLERVLRSYEARDRICLHRGPGVVRKDGSKRSLVKGASRRNRNLVSETKRRIHRLQQEVDSLS